MLNASSTVLVSDKDPELLTKSMLQLLFITIEAINSTAPASSMQRLFVSLPEAIDLSLFRHLSCTVRDE
ncbi:hypothetical protein MtrunA17_Chr7g0267511 [Medicago truncatula]|uniref:Uncharacterized protein n=1 Tax=Medicago truncatula TaxID=3880 RepID=I3SU34_MEDTR|nr:unknown [Medicago truncatula]RHN48789.1 hypothetical protein MtrunA17_Chr7g0267511 [Medicago truncatula]